MIELDNITGPDNFVRAAIDKAFGGSIDFKSIGGSVLGQYPSNVAGVEFIFEKFRSNSTRASNPPDKVNSIDTIFLSSRHFENKTAIGNENLVDTLVQSMIHEMLHRSVSVDAKKNAVYAKLDLKNFSEDGKLITGTIAEELVLRATIEILADNNDTFSTTPTNFPSINAIIRNYRSIKQTDGQKLRLTDPEFESLTHQFKGQTYESILSEKLTLADIEDMVIRKLSDNVDLRDTFSDFLSTRDPGETTYNDNGSVASWADQFGVTGFTDGGSRYSDSFLNFYGTVDDDFRASASFGAHLRALGDLIGLDRKPGLDGSFAKDKEGSKVPLTDSGGGGSEAQKTGPSVTDRYGNAVTDGNGNTVLGRGDASHGDGEGGESYGGGGYGGGSTGKDAAEGLPIILDLTGDGIQITVLSQSTVFFDTTGDGLQNQTAWAGAGDAVLFYDPDGTGELTEKRQYVFTEWDPTATSDIEALRSVFDSNNDGVFDANDDEWSNFKVMVTNADGSLEAKSLDDPGVDITSIDLTADATNIELPDGSVITGKTTFTRSDGSTGTVADTTLVANANGYRVETIVSVDGAGVRTEIQTGYASGGAVAFEITSVTAADGSSIANSYDDTGDGVVNRLQTIVTVINADGSKTETVTNKIGASDATAVLSSRTVTDTSADGTIVTISRDSVGGNWFDQIEIRTTHTDDSMTIETTDLGQDGSAIRNSTETVSANGLSRTDAIDENGDSVVDLTIEHVIVLNPDGSRSETITYKNNDGSTRSSVEETVLANGRDKTILRDVDGDGDPDTEENLVITVNGDGSTSSTLTTKNQDGSTRSQVVQSQSDDALTKTIQSDADGDTDFELTTVEATTIQSDGSRETITTLTNFDASVRAMSKVTLASDKVETETWFDLNQNGIFEATDLVKSVAVDGTTLERTAEIWVRNADGSVVSKNTVVTSADGLSQQSDFDADGDNNIDTSTFDVTTLDVDNDSTRTVSIRNQDSTLRSQTVVSTSADGLETSTTLDRDGDGNLDFQTHEIHSQFADGSTEHTATRYAGDGSTVLSKSTDEMSSDRRILTSSVDVDGDGATDALVVSVEALDGSRAVTNSLFNADGSLISVSETQISDDGLERTIVTDIDGDGADDSKVSSITTLSVDGSRTTVERVENGNDSFRNETKTHVSDDGLVTTVSVDADGDETYEWVWKSKTKLKADGSVTILNTTKNADADLLYKSREDISDDGLDVIFRTDTDGDGSYEFISTTSTTLLQDGGTKVDFEMRDSAGDLRSASVTEANDNLRDITVSRDVNGDGAFEQIETLIVADDGSFTKTISNFESDETTLQSRTQNSVSDDGLFQFHQIDRDGDGTYDLRREEDVTLNADGSVLTTISTKSADGQVYSESTLLISDDGLLTIATSDRNNDGDIDITTDKTIDLSLEGVETVTQSGTAADGSLLWQSVKTTSSDGRTVALAKDIDGDGINDLETTTTRDETGLTTKETLYFAKGTASASGVVSTRSDDGFETTRSVDLDGDGIFEYVTTESTNFSLDGTVSTTIAHKADDGSVLAQEYYETSDDGLVIHSDFDEDGDNDFELKSTDTTSYLNNGDVSRILTTIDGQLNPLSEITHLTSGNGLTSTITSDFNGDGDDNRTVLTVYGAEGGLTETKQEFGTDGGPSRSSIRTVSEDGWTETVNLDRDGDATDDLEIVWNTDLDMDSTIVYRDLSATNQTLAEFTKSTSANGLTRETLFNLDGAGSAEIKFKSETTFDVAGNRTVVFSETMGAATKTFQTETTYAADGLSSTKTIDIDGDNEIDGTSQSTTKLNSDGSQETVTETLYANGDLRSSHSRAISRDGLTTTEEFDFDGNGKVNTIDELVVSASGTSVLTKIGYNDDGDEVNRLVTSTSASALVTTILRDGVEQTVTHSFIGNGSYTWDNGKDYTSTVDNGYGVSEDASGHFLVSHQVDALGFQTWTSVRTWETVPGEGASSTETHSVRLDAESMSRLFAESARLYDTVFDRDMARDESELLVRFVVNGELDQSALAEALISSAEFTTRFETLTDAEFITLMYQNSFGRAPSLTELDAQLRDLSSGTSQSDLAVQLAESAEHLVIGNSHRITNNFDIIINAAEFERTLDGAYVEAIVKNLVDVIYDRDPTDYEIEYLSNLLMEGDDDITSMAEQLLALDGDIQGVSSNSLKDLSGATLVVQAFQNGLGSAPTPTEQQLWEENLSAGRISVAQFVASLAQSVDHLTIGNVHNSNSVPTVQTSTGTSGANALDGTATQDVLLGLAGNDTLTGNDGSDKLIGGTGNDILQGGAGSDHYAWSHGDGDDTIRGEGLSALEMDIIELSDVSSGDVTLKRDIVTNNLTILIAGSNGGSIVVENQFSETKSGGEGIEAIEFFDGVIWTAGQIDELTQLQGSATGNGDIIYGVSGNDTINGDAGNDGLYGGAGDDLIDAGSGVDLVYAGDGDDHVLGGTEDDILVGGTGADYLVGNSGNDVLNGGTGSDFLIGNNDDDTLNGGVGDDTLSGGVGADVLDGGDGEDTANYEESDSGVTINLSTGIGTHGEAEGDTLTAIEHVDGSNFDDQISGNDSSNFLNGFSGADTLNGGDGDDSISGGSDNDDLQGGLGDDSLDGEDGDDSLSGGSGNDTIEGGAGDDVAYGGFGVDSIMGGDGDDLIYGDNTPDYVVGFWDGLPAMSGNANDIIALLYYASDAWMLENLAPSTIAAMANSARSHYNARLDLGWQGEVMEISFDPYAFLASHLDLLTLISNIEDIIEVTQVVTTHYIARMDIDPNSPWVEFTFDPEIYYANYSDLQAAFGPNSFALAADYVHNGHNNGRVYDHLINNNDTLVGGSGDDTLFGGDGADYLDGGDGALDYADYGYSNAGVHIDMVTGTGANGHAQGDQLVNIEGILGSANADYFLGNSSANVLEGAGGDDDIFGNNGDDSLYGGLGSDNLDGGSGNDLLVGGNGHDVLQGGDGDDFLIGDAQNGQFELPQLTSGRPGMSTTASDGVAMLYFVSGSWFAANIDPAASIAQKAQFARDHFGYRQADPETWAGEVMSVTFDVYRYLASHLELLAYIPDIHADDEVYEIVSQHYLARLAADPNGNWLDVTFSTETYLANNSDLYDVFGVNAHLLARHYVVYGFSEGSIADHLIVESNDTLVGGLGDDTLAGGDDNDSLDGGVGNDSLEGGDGHDTLTGGDGDDVIWVGAQGDNSYGNDEASGGVGNDLIYGSNGADTLRGDEGNDTISGGEEGSTADKDKIYGGDGDDLLQSGQTTTPTAERMDDGDNLYGGNGDDTLVGGAANDKLSGGKDDDSLEGGLGADQFVFKVNGGLDVVLDFENDVDEIDLTDFSFADSATAMNFASQNGDDVVFDFGIGDILTLSDTLLVDVSDDLSI
jgi:Ca2+-binding RTX toxin-like protein